MMNGYARCSSDYRLHGHEALAGVCHIGVGLVLLNEFQAFAIFYRAKLNELPTEERSCWKSYSALVLIQWDPPCC